MATLRSFHDEDMKILATKATEIARAIGTAHSLAVETLITDDYPAAICDPDLNNQVASVAKDQNREVFFLKEPNRWSEDFAHFTHNGKGVLFGLGVGENVHELHSPEYDFPDDAIQHGIEILDSIISRHLR